jgi:hypothetical protein
MSEEQKSQQSEEQVEDLDVGKDEAQEVKGGRKAGKGQQEYLQVKLEDVQITSYQLGG